MVAYTLERLVTDGLPLVLGYLMPVAAGNATINYGTIAMRLCEDLEIPGRIFSPQIGFVVGSLMNRLQEVAAGVPLINVLVVNQATGMPGNGADGYLQERFGVMAGARFEARRSELVALAAREVYAFRDWRRIYRKAFGTPIPTSDPHALVIGTEKDGQPPARRGARGGEAESREHRNLKAYISSHACSIGLDAEPDRTEVESLLLSGDEVDVIFETGRRVDLVEVKSVRSNRHDLQRGIYQCVKYRAVFDAQRRALTPDMRIIATLVLQVEPSSDIRDLAKRLGVELRVVHPEQMLGSNGRRPAGRSS